MVYLYKYKLRQGEKKNSLRFIEDSIKRCFREKGSDITVYKDEAGRPLTDREGVWVSATHTGETLICAISERPVGIDAQIVKDGLDGRRIAGRFFTHEEEKKVLSDGMEAFYEIWCRKEAFSKVVGKGISYGLKNIETVDDTGRYASEVEGFRMIGERITEGYFACAGGEGDLQWIEIQE
ncbi:MAG: 4'-phosphopantetheinyl transferase superfamily protein [Clostridiales bacterium]|nr:4'-phosphopantetheinyl transferase superfamily protein [Clostridiales bacterium]